jgi:hypothetical protein
VFGRKSAALAGSTLTPVMSTPLEKVNPKPAKVLLHGAAPGQNGVPVGPLLVIVI